MSMPGYNAEDYASDWIKSYRRMRYHPVVGFLNEDGTRRAGVVACEMTAWMDLCMEASWKDRQVNNKGKVILLERGQFVAARRWLAARWGWTEDKVRWFLKKLQGEGMIAVAAPAKESDNQAENFENHTQLKARRPAHYANVLTVCNYNVYQAATELNTLLSTQQNTQSTPNQHPHTKKERKEEEKNLSANADSSTAAPVDLLAVRRARDAGMDMGRVAAAVAASLMAATLPVAAAPIDPPAYVQQHLDIGAPPPMPDTPPRKRKRQSVPEVYSKEFGFFWELYPRREGKGEAFKSWQRLSIEQQRRAYVSCKAQLDGLLRKASDSRGNFCPLPATWINQGRFDDEVQRDRARTNGPAPAPRSKPRVVRVDGQDMLA